MMIPKVIHYCWFGRGEKSKLAEKCIDSWRRILPDFEIKEWNEDNFNTSESQYTKDAYAKKKYAFVSDYARFKILYQNGGIYMDVDVEVLKPLNPLLVHQAFSGFEHNTGVAPGLILGAQKGNALVKEMLDKYDDKNFLLPDGSLNYETVVTHTTEVLVRHGLILNGQLQEINDMIVYPEDYFSPKSYYTGKITLTENTYSIHHYAASWHSPYQKFREKLWKLIGRSSYS